MGSLRVAWWRDEADRRACVDHADCSGVRDRCLGFCELTIPRQLCRGDHRARPTVSRAVVFFAVFATSPVPEKLRQNAVSFFETENRFATDVRLHLRAMYSAPRVGRRFVRQLAR